MAEPRNLRVKVQADRLPNVGNVAQIALRVSAAIAGDDGDLLAAATDEILPWKWTWNPHDPGAWQLWQIAGGVVTAVDPHSVSVAVDVPTGFDPPDIDHATGRFDQRLTQDVEAIVDTAGLDAALCAPKAGAEVVGRTVYALVESLTTLPHPVPAAKKVFTAFTIDPAPTDNTLTFIAAPKFATPSGGTYDVDPTPPAVAALYEKQLTVAGTPTFNDAFVDMYPTLPWDELDPAHDPQRLIDLTTMLVKKPNGASSSNNGLTDDDWAASLARRIATTVEPFARIMSIFDDSLTNAIADDVDLRRILSGSGGPRLLQALDAVAWQSIGPRAAASPVAAPPNMSVVDGIARRQPLFQEGATGLVLSDADYAARNIETRPDRTNFVGISGGHLDALIGVPPNPSDIPAAREADSIETDSGLIEFIARHWLGGISSSARSPLPGGTMRTIAARWLAIRPDQPAFTTAATDAPLLDVGSVVTALTLGDTRKLGFKLELDPPTVDFALDLEFIPPPGQRAPAKVSISRAAGATRLTVKIIEDGTERITGDLDPALPLEMSITAHRVPDPAGPPPWVGLEISNVTTTPFVTDRLRAGPFFLRLSASGGDIGHVGMVMPDMSRSALRDAFVRIATGAGLRADTAIALVGPYIAGLTAGRLTWDQPQPLTERQAAAQRPLNERLVDSVAALVKVAYAPGATVASLYDVALQRALREIALDQSGLSSDDAKLAALLTRLFTNAAADAILRARALASSIAQDGSGGDDHSRRLTIGSPPLVFRFDQLQSFEGTDDLWTRLAGLGVLIARTRALTDSVSAWWSLNVANLHAPAMPTAQQPQRPPLDDSNAVTVHDGGGVDKSIVNPVPLQVGEIDGVRAAMLAYDNRSIVAEMGSDAGLSSPAALFARRIEAYRFPAPATAYRLPALSFGYAFHVLPFIIGHGGALPPILRADAAKPLGLKPAETTAPLKGQFTLASNADAFVRAALYRRTRPVGAPRLVPHPSQSFPGVPAGVGPLASEIAIRPSPVTIGGNIEGRYFLDKEGSGGVLDMHPSSSGEEPGLRIDINATSWTDASPRTLTVLLRGRTVSNPDVRDLANIPLNLTAQGACRLELYKTGSTASTGVPEPDWAEDEFAWTPSSLGATYPDIAEWHNIQLILSANQNMNIEPPVVTPLTRGATTIEVSKPLIAPEAAHQTRQISVLDGIDDTAGPLRTISLQRPSLDFETYSRWINAPLFDTSATGDATVIAQALDAAHLVATTVAREKRDRSLDDPAVTQLYAELVRIFPTRHAFDVQPIGSAWATLKDLIGFDNDARRTISQQISVQLIDDSVNEGLSSGVAKVLRGRIYELRVYAGLPPQQPELCPFTRDQRFSAAVRATLRQCPITAAPHSSMMLAGPLVQTIEVATSELPIIVQTRPLDFELRRRPKQSETEWIRLRDEEVAKFYPAIRYANLAQLESQRWNWRGRPQDDLWPDMSTQRDADQFTEQFKTAFVDRRDTDVGEILERRMERAHAYNGRRRLTDGSVPRDNVPRLFEKSLDWRGGVNFWRFGLRMVSRYQPMRPGNAALVVSSHRLSNGSADWQQQVVLDRPSDRAVKKPGLSLVLPLTENMMGSGVVPPLLALFNDPFHANFHVGDGIDVAIEMARHPLPEGNVLKYWQEWGPDPIRTGVGADGGLLPLRLDGPIGYTFDLETESGRFDHAGLLVTPLNPAILPWSLAKLRFRRQETPEGIDPATAFTGVGPVSNSAIPFPCGPRIPTESAQWRVENSQAVMQRHGPKNGNDLSTVETLGIFPTEHEGLVVDLPDMAKLSASSTVTISFFGCDSGGVRTPSSDYVTVTLTPGGTGNPEILLSFKTHLGEAGQWTLPIPVGALARIRIVTSVRDKPEKGDPFKPAGDVVVKARITRQAFDTIINPIENRWIAVACVPLTSSATVKVGDPIEVKIDTTLPASAGATVAPVRLSQFTQGLWCQFAEAMSQFNAICEGLRDPQQVTSDQLQATVDGTKVTLAIAPGTGALPGRLLSLQPTSITDPKSQLEETLVLVVTRFIRDAFDRMRERPVAVKSWDAKSPTVDLSTPDWPTRDGRPLTITPAMLGKSGRVRFLRILSGKNRSEGGFLVDDKPIFPGDFFTYDTIEADAEMNPPDAQGMVLGVSMPIPWSL